MQTLNIQHRNGSYPIHIGDHLLSQPSFISANIPNNNYFLVTDQTVADAVLPTLNQHLALTQNNHITLPPGETQKSFSTFMHIIDVLTKNHCARDTTLIALGGGVIGDLTGFVSACYMRGTPFVQIPTTLLAQVDASIGGKTAINHPAAKNLIGAFHAPQSVIIDTHTLSSLPDREFHSGLAEIIKAALIFDHSFFNWLEDNMHRLMARDASMLHHAIYRACQIKQHFVEKDEADHGYRQHLNFGHTFGHALEQVTNYQVFLHGEAVGIGILAAAYLSQQITGLKRVDFERIYKLLLSAKILKKTNIDQYIRKICLTMQHDKKIQCGRLRLILLSKIGQSIISDQVAPQTIQSTWTEICNYI